MPNDCIGKHSLKSWGYRLKILKGDFKDNSSQRGKRALFTYEYRGRNHKSYFLGFSGGQGKPFINLLKTKIKYHEEPY